MKRHTLKTIEPYFSELAPNSKSFEIRYNDRNFQKGDKLLLLRYDPEKDELTGEKKEATITYVLKDFEGLKDGYVALGIQLH